MVVASSRIVVGLPGGAARLIPSESLRPDALCLLMFLCGACIGVRLDIVGEIYLVELLLPLTVIFTVLARGLGARLEGRTLILFLSAGALTFTGYLISDLVVANAQWQYLRGWGRVALLITDFTAMLLLVAHGARNLWWFVFGLGLGGIGWLIFSGVPIGTWKIGYGEYTAFLAAALSGLLPRYVGAILLAACGVASLLLDYRSLGATCILGAALLAHASRRRVRGAAHAGSTAGAVAMVALAMALMLALLGGTRDQFQERRDMSNGGRSIGVMVAMRAIAESPVIGYGSWAEEGRFAQMMRNEAARLERELGRRVDIGRSLLPHSQLLQAWVEGGVLGAAFFLLYGAMLLWALHWYVLRRPVDRFSGAAIFALLYGLWNFAASPFLGFTRIYIAIAVGAIVVARWECRRAGRQRRFDAARGAEKV